MKLIIVRHGETDANRHRICQGQTHGSLNAEGIRQAQQVALRLKNEKIDVCFSSDLGRAIETAQEIVHYHPHLPIISDKRLRERYFGSFQGKVFPEKLEDFVPPIETETAEEIIVRLHDFLNKVYRQYADKTVLVVSHGFTIRVLFSIFLNLETTDLETLDDIRNTSVSVVEMERDSYTISLHNDISHLSKDIL